MLVLLPPWQKEVVFFGSVGLSVCHFVDNITQQVINGLGGILGSTMKNWLNCGGDLGFKDE